MYKILQGKAYKLFCLILLFSFSILIFSPVPAFSADAPGLRIEISLQQGYAELTLNGGYKLVNMGDGMPLALPEGRYRLAGGSRGIQVLDMLNNSCGLFGGPLCLKPVSAQPSSQFFQLHNACYGLEYRGALEVYLEGGALKAVNILDLESYLQGVLPREVSPSWGNYGGMEALKAQAVAARTYALYSQSQQKHKNFHLCDTQHCQVYGGKSCEAENTNRALAQTRGEILTYNGTGISPFYHACNGGYTEIPQNVWTGSLPYYTACPDPYDDPANPLGIKNFVTHRYAEWEADVPLDLLAQLLAGNRSGPSAGAIEGVEVISSSPSGRVQELCIQGQDGKNVSLYKESARTDLGLRSQLYTVDNAPESRVWITASVNGAENKECLPELEGKWAQTGHNTKGMLMGGSFMAQGDGLKKLVPYWSLIIKGYGWGHGIGMSQNGAYNRSRDGQGYKEILSFYYPGTEIKTGF